MYEFFRNLPLFNDFLPDEFSKPYFQDFLRCNEEITLNSNQILIKQGTKSEFLYFLKKGLLDVFIAGPKGFIHFVETRHPQAIIGEMELFDEQPIITNIRAKTDCIIYQIEYSAFRKLLAAKPILNQKLLKILLSKWRNVELSVHQVMSVMLESNEYLSSFASTVAHDLKSPLQSIMGHSNMLKVNLKKKVYSPSNLNHIDKIERNTSKMGQLIDGIFRYSAAIHHSSEDYEPIDIREVINEVINLLEPPSGVKIDIEDFMPVIVCNKIHIIQIFQNLLSNALKNLDKTKKVIALRYEKNDEFWEFSIRDNGIGIKDEDLERIMNLFQRVDSDPDDSGTGIGLTIVERIVNIYGGRFWIDSQYGKRTTVHFTLSKTILSFVGSSE